MTVGLEWKEYYSVYRVTENRKYRKDFGATNFRLKYIFSRSYCQIQFYFAKH